MGDGEEKIYSGWIMFTSAGAAACWQKLKTTGNGAGNVSQPRGVGNFRCWCCRLLAETLVNICTECPQIWIIWNVNEKHVNTTVLSVPKILIVSYQSVLNIFSIFYIHKTSVLQSQNRPEPEPVGARTGRSRNRRELEPLGARAVPNFTTFDSSRP